jgi:carboxyl-terminal processing protease
MKHNATRRLLIVVVLVACMFGSFTAGSITGYLARPVLAADQPAEFGVFWEAWDVVVNHFVDRDKIDFTAMTYGAIQGMLDSLGDQNHTTFFSPEVAQQEANYLEGTFEGIGAYIDTVDEQFKVIAPIHGSPAEVAGILAGDIVLMVDGEEITGMQEWEVIAKVRGPAGTSVVLTVVHPEQTKPIAITIVRAKIDVESVVWARVPETDLAYIQITQFATDTGAELETALKAIQAEGRKGNPIAGIILDLRNNPGGLLHEAVRVGSEFLPEGDVILNQRDADGRVSSYKSQGPGLGRDLPMVVLINEGSASAAEILSGALQDHGRAQLVGATTVGTGTVLVPFELSDGSVIRLGVTNWLTPKMNLIKNQGIHPDIAVEQDATVDKVDGYTLRETPDPAALPQEDQQFNAARDLLQSTAHKAKS